MKNLKINLIKITLIATIFFSISVTNTHALAVIDAFNGAFNKVTSFQALFTAGKAALTEVNTFVASKTSIFLLAKEKFLDPIAFLKSSLAIAGIKGELANAISSGGIDGVQGGSAFLDDPEQFFKNIAKDQEALIKKELLGAAGGVLDAQNKDIFKLFTEGIKDDGKSFEKAITSTIGSTICSKLSTELQNAKSIKDNQVDIALIQASYNASCSTGDKATQYQNQKDCAKDFSCGGFDSILAITQNLGKNTDAGRYEALLAKYEKDVAKETEIIDKELDRSGGFLNKKKCVKFSEVENRKVCIKYEAESPGVAAANSLQKLIVSPIDENLRVDELGEMITNMAGRFLGNLIGRGINKGINAGVKAIKDGQNSEVSSIQSSVQSIGLASQAPSNNGSSSIDVNPTATPGFELEKPPAADPMFELGIGGAKEYIELSKPLIEAAGKENLKARSFVQKELSAYLSVSSSYQQVDACYLRKEGERIKPGSTAVPYPQSIPANVSSRALELLSKSRNLQNIIVLSQGVENYVNAKIVDMVKSTNSNVIDFYRDKIFSKIESSASLKNSDWEIRDLENTMGSGSEGDTGLYNRLSTEAAKTLSNIITEGSGENITTRDISPLAICNEFDPNPQLRPVETGNDNNSR